MLHHSRLPKLRKGRGDAPSGQRGQKDSKKPGAKSLGCSKKGAKFSVVSTKGGVVGNKMERKAVECFQAGGWPRQFRALGRQLS